MTPPYPPKKRGPNPPKATPAEKALTQAYRDSLRPFKGMRYPSAIARSLVHGPKKRP